MKQFWSYVTNNTRFGCCRITWLYDGGIDYDTGDPEIPKACSTIFGDQNVSLDRMGIGAYLKLVTHSALTGLILLCTILIECRYLRPQVACASYDDEVSNGLHIRIIGVAYQL